MRKLNIVAKNIDRLMRVTDSLVGKHVVMKHSKYPEVNDVVIKVHKMPGIDVKQISFKNSQPRLVREGDKFIIEVLNEKA